MSRDRIPDLSTREEFDCIVVGAGIAGASAAAELARDMRIALVEREGQPGYHTTGRSAAVYTHAYGPAVIRALTRASGAFFDTPESDFLSDPLLRRRDVLFVARNDQLDVLLAMQRELGTAVTRLDGNAVTRAAPLLREGYAASALLDASASDIDVHALHQHYLRSFKAAGGTLLTKAEVTSLDHDGAWSVQTTAGALSAPILVNAAGAWADEIAAMAGVERRGLVPKRRTALIVAGPDGVDPDAWPMVVDVEEQFYLKPDAGKMLISPADAEPSPPCDAQPEELAMALCVDRIERAFDLSISRIESRWAGLRSFFPNGCPLAAYDDGAPGFFWLAGQGGYGIQTAPALARAAAALIRHEPLPDDIRREGITAADLGARRHEVSA